MKRNLKIKLVLIGIVVGLSLLSYLIKDIRMGLDLRGGMHLILEVKAEEALEGTLERYVSEITDTLRRKRIRYQEVVLDNEQRINIQLRDKRAIADVEDIMSGYPTLEVLNSDLDKGLLVYAMNKGQIQETTEGAIRQALETIRKRIDQYGVSEPTIQKVGDRRILVQLPEIDDPKEAKELIGRIALLEFKLVDEENIGDALRGKRIAGSEILYQIERNRETGDVLSKRPWLLKKRTVLTGASLVDARVRIDTKFSEPTVSIRFDGAGARQFARITGDNVGRRLAIVLDNEVYSAPVIREKISGGSAQISGGFRNDQEAGTLAIALRSGALPASLEPIEERTVSPSLGRDSVQRGIKAILVGGLLVVVFMVIYYGFSGLIANVALFMNLIIILGALSYLGATLTLPGIAGIILTIGMAVDANVLIFERIKEELRMGKTVRAAVDGGFAKALVTILDANVTTLIAGIVLFQFGTGPVKGFAVTLSLGILGTLFSSLFVSRTFFEAMLARPRAQKISI